MKSESQMHSLQFFFLRLFLWRDESEKKKVIFRMNRLLNATLNVFIYLFIYLFIHKYVPSRITSGVSFNSFAVAIYKIFGSSSTKEKKKKKKEMKM